MAAAAADAPARSRRKPDPNSTSADTAKATGTDYIVLQRIDLKVGADALPEGLNGLHPDAPGVVYLWRPLRNEKAEHGPDGELRVVTSARGDEHAIKLATKLDSDAPTDAEAQRPGTFRAIPLRNWKGTVSYENEVVTRSKATTSDD